MQRAFIFFLITAALLSADAFGDDKIDDGLGGEKLQPVFVRMTRQLFARGGEYETFCRENADRKRGELRREVLQVLKRNSDESWKAIEPTVTKLQKDGSLRDLQRYWIVNGFACRATGDACRAMAKDPNVSFVYLQRLPVPLHRVDRPTMPERFAARYKEVFQGVLDDWKDDGDEPVTTDGLVLPWNLKRIKADQAWTREGATGKGVVVAMIDSGLLVTPSLTRALWLNTGEQFNGKDDDGNGYVDDLFGWDIGRDSWYVLDDGPMMTHGSMCAGIVAGRPLNSKNLITGVAPRARLMVLRGAGGPLKAYEYALANGADVISMSYMCVGIPLGNYRGLYRLAHEHLAAAGIVAVGGAGNFAGSHPRGKQIGLPKDIPCVIAAAGICEDGSKAPASSEGPCTWSGVKFYDDYPEDGPLSKPDVTGCFGGYPMWGRPSVIQRTRGRWTLTADEGGDVGLIVGPEGNSFAGPHAAGVAALMLSVRPDLNAWQVKQLMEQTCTDIGEEGRDYTFGAGLLDALEAVRAARNVPPR
ncbi:MAG: S8 family serine peptidase [Planctomycetes bacterium]|nr:S8 family serine peptidase [Planctomycetota bacterium]